MRESRWSQSGRVDDRGALAEPEVWGNLSQWNSPLLTGRVVAALVASGDLQHMTGEALVVEDLAKQLGIFDERARLPASVGARVFWGG